MLVLGFLCSTGEVAECDFYRFLCVTKCTILKFYLSRVLLLVGHMTDKLSLSHMTPLIQVMTPFVLT